MEGWQYFEMHSYYQILKRNHNNLYITININYLFMLYLETVLDFQTIYIVLNVVMI